MKKVITALVLMSFMALFSGCSTIEDTLQTIDDNVHKNKLASESLSSDETPSGESDKNKTIRTELNTLIGKTQADIISAMGTPTSRTLTSDSKKEIYTYRNYKKGNNRLEFYFENGKAEKWIFYRSKLQ